MPVLSEVEGLRPLSSSGTGIKALLHAVAGATWARGHLTPRNAASEPALSLAEG